MGLRLYRSASQYDKMQKCPYEYYLTYVEEAWRKPAAWLAQGTAVHVAAEWWERSGRRGSLAAAQEVYTESYDKEIGKLCEDTPNFDHWFGSGWRYPAVEDIPRRYGLGLEMVDRYLDWYQEHPEQKPWVTDNGELAVELEFEVTLGTVPVRGMIDMVLKDRVRDNKTGRKPGNVFQLVTYKTALEVAYGHKVNRGDFWMGRTGRPGISHKLSEWSIERVTDEYGKLDEDIRAERFDPNPSEDNCGMCSVRDSCQFGQAFFS